MKRVFIISLLIILPFIQNRIIFSQDFREEAWKLPGKDTLSLETIGSTKVFISGSNSGEIEIKLRYIAKPDEKFELKERQEAVYLKENILDYDRHRPTRTYFNDWTWTINVPHGTYIKCFGGSGNFKVVDFNGFFKGEYGSGRFIFDNVNGNVEILLAQIYAQIHNSKGSFNLGSAVGSIRATGLTITGNSSFSSGIGSIKISLANTPAADLYVFSNFNKAKVDFNGHPATGYFELIARKDEGKIRSPFKFDKEEIFMDDIRNYRNSSDFGKKSDFSRKSFTRGDSKPKITLKTVNGTAQLIK